MTAKKKGVYQEAHLDYNQSTPQRKGPAQRTKKPVGTAHSLKESYLYYMASHPPGTFYLFHLAMGYERCHPVPGNATVPITSESIILEIDSLSANAFI